MHVEYVELWIRPTQRNMPSRNGAGGRTRTGTVLSNRGIFIPATAFAALLLRVHAYQLVCGLDYTFTVVLSRVRCCPSSLYTFAPASRRERLARGCQLKGFPEFEQFYSLGFPKGTQRLKSLASTISPRPL